MSTAEAPGAGLLDRIEPPRKVAVLKASRIGDFLCTVPALRALRARLPEAEITLITLPMLKDLALHSPYVDRFAPFPGFPGIAEQIFKPRRTVAFLQAMQRERFDLAIQFQGSGSYSNPFLMLLGARHTAGFVREDMPAGRLDASIPLPQSGHEVERMLALATHLGATPRGLHTEFPLTSTDRSAAQALLGDLAPPLIGLHPAARDQTRRWMPERFAQAAAELQSQVGGTLVLVGEAEDAALCERIGQMAGGATRSLAGITGLPVLGAMIERLALLITNDSGPAHIAYALGTPSVTVFGGADPARYGPPVAGPHRVVVHAVDCRPCGYATCPIGLDCLQGVSAEEVSAAGREVLRGGEISSPHRLAASRRLLPGG
jgi:ADP-heptose:LPS heptosyltransferase